jgi:hypothetical protein
MQTYWLSGAKDAYIEYATLLESKTDSVENELLSDYHPTMYEINERRVSLANVINKLPSTTDQCPFSTLKPAQFI